MKYCFFYHAPVAQMLDHDSVEQRWRYAPIPDSIGIHDDDWSAGTYAQARCFATFHSRGSKEQILTLQKRWEHLIQFPAPSVG